MHTPTWRSLLLPALLATTAAAAHAQTEISHDVAMAGSLPGDAAGYPVTINEPGHYRLTGNLEVPLNVNAIVVKAPGVTLDLNGYTVSSSVVCQQNASTYQVNCNVTNVYDDVFGKSGIYVEDEARGSVVRNGTISGFRGHGLVIRGAGGRVEHLRVQSNRHAGMWLRVSGAVVRVSDSTSQLNGDHGFDANHTFLERVTASRNGGSGVNNSAGIVVDGHMARNARYGVEGDVAAGKVGVRDSLVMWNKLLNMGPSAVSMGGNKTQGALF